MGQKVHPTGIRLGIVKKHASTGIPAKRTMQISSIRISLFVSTFRSLWGMRQ